MQTSSRNISAAFLALSMFAAAPALAMDNNQPMGTTTKDTLKADGYTCELVSVGFWECTKSGGTTYWCDATSCQPKPARTGGNRGGKLNGITIRGAGLKFGG